MPYSLSSTISWALRGTTFLESCSYVLRNSLYEYLKVSQLFPKLTWQLQQRPFWEIHCQRYVAFQWLHSNPSLNTNHFEMREAYCNIPCFSDLSIEILSQCIVVRALSSQLLTKFRRLLLLMSEKFRNQTDWISSVRVFRELEVEYLASSQRKNWR